MDVIETFNRDYADELYEFLIKNHKNPFFRFGIPKNCSLLVFRNYYTQEIINSEYSNSELTSFEKVLFFPISEDHKVFGLITATLYLKKYRKSQVYIEILFNEDHKEIEVINKSLEDVISYIVNNFKLDKGIIYFMISKKDLAIQEAIFMNGGIVYNCLKQALYMRIIF